MKLSNVKGNLWFTGCTHFGHANIIKLTNRPFEDVAAMDAALIKNWNATVGKNDTVFHLGDFAYRNKRSARDYQNALNGTIIHIRGNHDHDLLDAPQYDYLELTASGRQMVLFHYPIHEWNGWFRHAIHLHCHTHQTERVTAKNRVNVTVEAWDYKPASLQQVLDAATPTTLRPVGRG